MAPADSTSSPRDHAADANPELARKKQRLSEDPGASPSDSIIIEADEPEDIGSNMDNAIEIEDGLSVTLPPYSDDFYMLSDSQQPLHHLRYLLQRIQQNYYLSIESLAALAQALEQHNDRTADETDEWKQHYLEDEAEFFNTLAYLIFTLLNTNDVFDPKEKADFLTIRQAVDRFLSGVERLSRRIIPCLPDTIKVTLSRRDSAHNSSRQHAINALFYCVVANQVLGSDERGIPSLAYIAGFDLKSDVAHLRKNNRSKFSTDAIISALAAIIRVLGGAMREVRDSWIVIQHTLNLFSTAVEAGSPVRVYPRGEVESVMEIVDACILPIIREKHPRALPDKFHDTVIKWGQQTLLQHVSLLDMSSATNTFNLFVNGSSDALLPEATGDGTVESVLQRVCDGNKDVLAKLIADSWTMQTAKTFICSDIMDIRTVGISALLSRLIPIHNHHQRFSPEGFEHPEVQHAVRFLRKNEVVAYILGPESRAGLLNQSVDVVTFLAATQTYTDAETDIIWQACSTSVEADFVKAAFAVLYKIKQWLDFERLLYIARKYSTTPVTSFGVDALGYLPDLLKEIEGKSSSLVDATDGLAVVFVSIEILKNSNCSDPCRTRDRLKQVALTEISRFACPPFTAGVRAQICKFCVPEILNRTAHATSAVEVLDVMLQPVSHHEDAEEVLSLLPLSAAVDELCSFVQTQKQNQALRPEIRGITIRLDCLARLVILSPTAPGADIHERLFAHLFGEEAFSNEARNAAWEKLYSMAFSGNSRPALVNLFQIYMRDYVAALPASLATPRLIEIMLLYLKSTCADDITEDDMTPLLSLPLWKSMLRFATTSPDEVVVRAAVGAILDVLFVFPCNGKVRPSAAIECQSEFVRKHIEGLRSLNDQFVAQKGTEDQPNYVLAMRLLNHVLDKSKEYLPAYKLAGKPDVLLLDDLHTATDQLEFTAQVYGINTHPNLIKVRARDTTKVSELLAKLPTFTSAAENRVIAGGVEITDVPDKTLSEVGVRESGVILIRPKYSFNLDLDKVLTNPGPVEQAILSQHSTLEAFLDGPDQTAFHVSPIPI
jgi:ubiquitin carboxyl-terminal hydrolase 34